MTFEEIILAELHKGHAKVGRIQDSQPLLMRHDIEFLLGRLEAQGKAFLAKGNRWIPTRKGRVVSDCSQS